MEKVTYQIKPVLHSERCRIEFNNLQEHLQGFRSLLVYAILMKTILSTGRNDYSNVSMSLYHDCHQPIN